MSVIFELGPTSATAVTLRPEHDYEPDTEKIEDSYRSKSGHLYVYKWSDYETIRFSVEYVGGNAASLINSWWQSNTQLLFFVTSGGVTDVHSVMLRGDNRPLRKFNKPGAQYFRGKILLEGY